MESSILTCAGACQNTGFQQMYQLELTIFSGTNIISVKNTESHLTCLMFSAKSAPIPIVELPRKPLGQALHLNPGCRLVQVVWGEHGKYKHCKKKNRKYKSIIDMTQVVANYLQTLIRCTGYSIKKPSVRAKLFGELLLSASYSWPKPNSNPWNLSRSQLFYNFAVWNGKEKLTLLFW